MSTSNAQIAKRLYVLYSLTLIHQGYRFAFGLLLYLRTSARCPTETAGMNSNSKQREIAIGSCSINVKSIANARRRRRRLVVVVVQSASAAPPPITVC